MLIGTAAGGVGVSTSFNLTYLPEYITWNDGGNAVNFLRVETKEDGVLHELPAAAIAVMRGWRHAGALAANQQFCRIANGKIEGKNVTITINTSAVGAINVFAFSDGIGTIPFRTTAGAVLALQQNRFDNFAALFLPGLVTVNDRAEITYHDGSNETLDVVELNARATLFQEAPAIVVDNLEGAIKKVEVFDAAGGSTAFMLKYVLPGQK